MIIKHVNPTMVEQLVNFENYKINALEQMIEFVNNSSISNKEEVIEEYKKMVENQDEKESIVLGGEFNQYVLKYDDFNRNLHLTNECDDTFGFGIIIEDAIDYFDYLDIADALNNEIEKYFGEKLEDCGEFWEIKENK